MRRRLAVTAAAALAALGALAGGAASSGSSKAPPLAGVDPITGRHVDIAAYRGRVVLVNIWASWCPPCIQEAPALAAFARAHAKDVVVLGIDTKDSVAAARRFYRRFGLRNPTVSDLSGKIAASWSLEVLPTSYYVSAKGEIVGFVFGPGTVQTFEQRLQIARLAR